MIHDYPWYPLSTTQAQVPDPKASRTATLMGCISLGENSHFDTKVEIGIEDEDDTNLRINTMLDDDADMAAESAPPQDHVQSRAFPDQATLADDEEDRAAVSAPPKEEALSDDGIQEFGGVLRTNQSFVECSHDNHKPQMVGMEACAQSASISTALSDDDAQIIGEGLDSSDTQSTASVQSATSGKYTDGFDRGCTGCIVPSRNETKDNVTLLKKSTVDATAQAEWRSHITWGSSSTGVPKKMNKSRAGVLRNPNTDPCDVCGIPIDIRLCGLQGGRPKRKYITREEYNRSCPCRRQQQHTAQSAVGKECGCRNVHTT